MDFLSIFIGSHILWSCDSFNFLKGLIQYSSNIMCPLLNIVSCQIKTQQFNIKKKSITFICASKVFGLLLQGPQCESR